MTNATHNTPTPAAAPVARLRELVAQATPGPWQTILKNPQPGERHMRVVSVCSPGGRILADCTTMNRHHAFERHPEEVANARLLALSPHLLPLAEALEKANCDLEALKLLGHKLASYETTRVCVRAALASLARSLNP